MVDFYNGVPFGTINSAYDRFFISFSMNKTDILCRDFCIVEYCMFFLKTHDSQRPVAKTLVWWVSVVPRITCGATVT